MAGKLSLFCFFFLPPGTDERKYLVFVLSFFVFLILQLVFYLCRVYILRSPVSSKTAVFVCFAIKSAKILPNHRKFLAALACLGIVVLY